MHQENTGSVYLHHRAVQLRFLEQAATHYVSSYLHLQQEENLQPMLETHPTHRATPC